MSKLARTTLMLMIATMMAKVLGLVRELVLASSYGASMYSDAYLTAMNIPLVIFAIIGTTLTTVLIPIYFQVDNELGEKEASKFINNISNIVIIICVIFAILGFIFAEPIVKVFAVGFEGETLKIAVDFTRVTIIGIIFTGLSYVMTSYLQIKNNFTVPGLSSVPKNIIIIISIIISIRYNPYIMIWGTLLGIATEFLFQLSFAVKNGYKYRTYINLNDKYIKKLAWLILPVLIGVAVNQINAMVDRTLASTLVEGSISALNYANKLNSFIMALFIASVGSVIYPVLSKLSNENNREGFTKPIVQSINSVVILVVPISVGAIVLSTPIVRLLFERGEFDERATSMTSIALIMYSIGMVSFGLRDILGKVFYAIQDTRTPMINGALTMIMNIILNLILIRDFELAGLALSTSISAIMCTYLLFRSLKNKMGYFGQDKIANTMIKSIFSVLIMGIVTNISYNQLLSILSNNSVSELIALSMSVIIGAVVYGILLIILRVEEIKNVLDIIRAKFNRN